MAAVTLKMYPQSRLRDQTVVFCNKDVDIGSIQLSQILISLLKFQKPLSLGRRGVPPIFFEKKTHKTIFWYLILHCLPGCQIAPFLSIQLCALFPLIIVVECLVEICLIIFWEPHFGRWIFSHVFDTSCLEGLAYSWTISLQEKTHS